MLPVLITELLCWIIVILCGFPTCPYKAHDFQYFLLLSGDLSLARGSEAEVQMSLLTHLFHCQCLWCQILQTYCRFSKTATIWSFSLQVRFIQIQLHSFECKVVFPSPPFLEEVPTLNDPHKPYQKPACSKCKGLFLAPLFYSINPYTGLFFFPLSIAFGTGDKFWNEEIRVIQ